MNFSSSCTTTTTTILKNRIIRFLEISHIKHSNSKQKIVQKGTETKTMWGGESYVNSICNCQIHSSDAQIYGDKTKQTNRHKQNSVKNRTTKRITKQEKKATDRQTDRQHRHWNKYSQ
jgi:hypothetical protein